MKFASSADKRREPSRFHRHSLLVIIIGNESLSINITSITILLDASVLSYSIGRLWIVIDWRTIKFSVDLKRMQLMIQLAIINRNDDCVGRKLMMKISV